MEIVIAQINPTIGDIKGNSKKIIEVIDRFKNKECLIIFPELTITGYPPKDLLFQKDFINAVENGLKEITEHVNMQYVILGTPSRIEGNRKLYNSAVVIHDKKIMDVVHKTLLPSYDVFDENRYFLPSKERKVVKIGEYKVALNICEDIWNIDNRQLYGIDVLEELSLQNPDFIVNISASPYHYKKMDERFDILKTAAKKYKLPVIYVNQVGGNDELIFDGNSVVINTNGQIVKMAKGFEEDIITLDTEQINNLNIFDFKEDISWIYKGLVLGIRDYFYKTGFTKRAVVGLSGGIDSAVVACLAVEALGKENVLGVSMPSRYSSEHSKSDAYNLAQNLSIEYRVYPIEEPFKTYIKMFNNSEETQKDLAEENIQARIRGNILMFISNRENRMVLTTGNKSEIAVGYCTLYGDMVGGLAVISDLPKLLVYELARYINREKEIIPENILIKPPSAELRPDQYDTDSLPPYDILDPILVAYIEDMKSIDEITELGYERSLVERVIKMVERAEYKRKQAAPGLKITSKAFGSGRRMPIVQRWT
ncbi:NAD+ synthase [Caldicellulosiruptoraceae bacterium PP1]